MGNLKKFRAVVILTLFFFVGSLVHPYEARALHLALWAELGQDFGDGGGDPGDEPPNSEPQPEPIQSPCSGGDPVYLHNGEYHYDCTSLVIPGRGMDVEIKHIYRSGRNFNNQFGYGWFLNYYHRLKFLSDGDVVIVNGDRGRQDEYRFDGEKYVSPPGLFETLVQNGDGTWTLTKAHGERFEFGIDGTLSAIVDRNGNQITFEYESFEEETFPVVFPVSGHSSFGGDVPLLPIIVLDFRLKKITDTVGRAIDLDYNGEGRLETIIDYAGRTVTFDYDPDTDDLRSITGPSSPQYPGGLTKVFSYDGDHNLETITDPKGQTFITNHYDAEGRVETQDFGLGTFTFVYANNQTTVIDRKGYSTVYRFNDTGNVLFMEDFTEGLREDDPISYVTHYTYNTDMMRASITFPKGNGIKFTYDESNGNLRARGNLLEIRRKANMAAADNDTNDLVTTMTYDPQFNFIKTISDPKGNAYTYTYDYELDTDDPRYGTSGNVVKVEYPQVNSAIPEVSFDYNAHGQIEEAVDPNGNIIKYEYFPATGYLREIIQDPCPEGGPDCINAVTQFTYDVYGNIDTITDPDNHTTDHDFNELNWLIEESNPLNYTAKYFYDRNGNLERIERQANETATQWQITRVTYTNLNKLKTVTDPLDRETTYNYDLNDNLESIIDAENNSIAYEYDERNLLFRILDANTPQGVTRYDYDDNGNIAHITDANNNTTDYVFDNFDRLFTQGYPDNLFSEFRYDKNSNLDRHITPSTRVLEYDYDALNRLRGKRFLSNASLNTIYNYDAGSRMTVADNVASQIGFTYDALNRTETTTQTINGQPYTLEYKYYDNSNRRQLIYPSGKTLDYTYDAHDRLEDILVNGTGLIHYEYDPLDRRDHRDYLTGITQRADYDYDIANQLEHLTNTMIGVGGISQYDYTYDLVSNRETMTGPDGARTYGYNDIYELENVIGAQNHVFDYDNVGNREIADGITYVPNELNQYDEVDGITFSYDDNGNLTNDGNNIYTYDAQNRLSSMTNATHTASYTYDAFNRRVSKTVDGVTTYFIYDGDEVIEERNASGALEADYVIGSEIDEVLVMTRGGETYYYHHDGLGSVTEITDTSGAIVENYVYSPYGQPSSLSAIGNPYYFTGRRFDDESEIYHYRARMYDPNIGRFLQRDPIGYTMDGLNLYEYTLSNPINYTDPLGLYRYETTNVGIAFIHESNPFNADSAMRQQMRSWMKFYTGDWSGAAELSGQSIVEEANTKCGISGWQIAYNAAQATSATAITVAVAANVSAFLNISKLKLDNVLFKTITKTRRTVGADGAISQIIKVKSRLTGKTVRVIHRVIKDGKIIHQHNKFP